MRGQISQQYQICSFASGIARVRLISITIFVRSTTQTSLIISCPSTSYPFLVHPVETISSLSCIFLSTWLKGNSPGHTSRTSIVKIPEKKSFSATANYSWKKRAKSEDNSLKDYLKHFLTFSSMSAASLSNRNQIIHSLDTN